MATNFSIFFNFLYLHILYRFLLLSLYLFHQNYVLKGKVILVIKAVKELVFKRKIKVISLNDPRQYNFNNVTYTLNFEIGRAVDAYHNNKNKEKTIRGLKYIREASRVEIRLRKLIREDKKLMTNIYLSNEVSISNIYKRLI